MASRRFSERLHAQKKTGPGIARAGVSLLLPLRGRALAPVVAAEAEAEAPGRCLSPGSPIHPGTSASPEAAEAAEVAEAAAGRWRPEVVDHARHDAVRTPAALEVEVRQAVRAVSAEPEVRGVEEAVLQADVDVRRDGIAQARDTLPREIGVAVGEANDPVGSIRFGAHMDICNADTRPDITAQPVFIAEVEQHVDHQ